MNIFLPSNLRSNGSTACDRISAVKLSNEKESSTVSTTHGFFGGTLTGITARFFPKEVRDEKIDERNQMVKEIIILRPKMGLHSFSKLPSSSNTGKMSFADPLEKMADENENSLLSRIIDNQERSTAVPSTSKAGQQRLQTRINQIRKDVRDEFKIGSLPPPKTREEKEALNEKYALASKEFNKRLEQEGLSQVGVASGSPIEAISRSQEQSDPRILLKAITDFQAEHLENPSYNEHHLHFFIKKFLEAPAVSLAEIKEFLKKYKEDFLEKDEDKPARPVLCDAESEDLRLRYLEIAPERKPAGGTAAISDLMDETTLVYNNPTLAKEIAQVRDINRDFDKFCACLQKICDRSIAIKNENFFTGGEKQREFFIKYLLRFLALDEDNEITSNSKEAYNQVVKLVTDFGNTLVEQALLRAEVLAAQTPEVQAMPFGEAPDRATIAEKFRPIQTQWKNIITEAQRILSLTVQEGALKGKPQVRFPATIFMIQNISQMSQEILAGSASYLDALNP